MKYHFNENVLKDFDQNIRKEWVVTNGMGGYAGGSITHGLNRTHQGYLIASLHAPVERFLVFTQTVETVLCEESSYSTEASLRREHGEIVCHTGNQNLIAFDYEAYPTFTFLCGTVKIKKSITICQGQNKTVVAYEITNTGTAPASLIITPYMNYREHSTNTTGKDFNFKCIQKEQSFCLIPQANPDLFIHVGFSHGILLPRTKTSEDDILLQTEMDNEVTVGDSHYTPFEIHYEIAPNSSQKISLFCQVTNSSKVPFDSSKDAFVELDERQKYVAQLLETAGYTDPWAKQLTIAANQFLSHRESTGLKTILAGLPWFTDWGRDTMIAFTGLTLCTKQFHAAAEILKTFAMYVDHGMVPNMFPDNGQEPLYNTVDASLWYFYAVEKYLEYCPSQESYAFIQQEIFPCLKEILQAYEQGTLFSIGMDTDGLIHAGSNLDQVTWMDVRVGDFVPTPRHGKPVEINALWYNALCVMINLCKEFHEDYTHYEQLSQLCKESFSREFWNAEKGCLYDVISVLDDVKNTPYHVGTGNKDDAVRPNQIYAVSLPHTMLSKEQEISVVNVVEEQLYAQRGLRSLSPAHSNYHPIYIGSLEKRDKAYHQGTSWGFLIGGFISAYMKVHGYDKETAKKAYLLLSPLRQHMEYENCIGSISEIFDGDAPHNGRGCYAQAWSIGETLRCYTEDILPYLDK